MSDALGLIVSIGAILVFLYGADTVKGWLAGSGGNSGAGSVQTVDAYPNFQIADEPLQNFDVSQLATPIQNDYGHYEGGS